MEGSKLKDETHKRIGKKLTPSKEDKQNEVLHQQLGVDGWQEVYADAPSEEDITKEKEESKDEKIGYENLHKRENTKDERDC